MACLASWTFIVNACFLILGTSPIYNNGQHATDLNLLKTWNIPLREIKLTQICKSEIKVHEKHLKSIYFKQKKASFTWLLFNASWPLSSEICLFSAVIFALACSLSFVNFTSACSFSSCTKTKTKLVHKPVLVQVVSPRSSLTCRTSP